MPDLTYIINPVTLSLARPSNIGKGYRGLVTVEGQTYARSHPVSLTYEAITDQYLAKLDMMQTARTFTTFWPLVVCIMFMVLFGLALLSGSQLEAFLWWQLSMFNGLLVYIISVRHDEDVTFLLESYRQEMASDMQELTGYTGNHLPKALGTA